MPVQFMPLPAYTRGSFIPQSFQSLLTQGLGLGLAVGVLFLLIHTVYTVNGSAKKIKPK